MASSKKMVWVSGIGALGLFLASVAAFSFTAKKATAPTESQDLVWVMRSDGAKSCSPKSGVSLEKALEELKAAGVKVKDSRKGNDGKMHSQVCGAPQGSTHSFLIEKGGIGAALSLGYEIAK
jgi:hypothetical protein